MPWQLQVDHSCVVSIDPLSKLLVVLAKALHYDAQLSEDVRINDRCKENTKSGKAGLEDSTGLLVYCANELGRHVQAIQVLGPGRIAVYLIVVIAHRVLRRNPQLVDFGVVPPAAGEAMDVYHQEEN